MFAERRRRFLDSLNGGAALLFAAPERVRSNDTTYRYRQDSDFHYLTGFPEPESAALFLPGESEEFVLFVRPRDPERETWDGRRAGPEGARTRFGADAAHPIDELSEMLPGFLENKERLYHVLGREAAHDELVLDALRRVRARGRRGVRAPEGILDPSVTLGEMRLVKSGEELAIMRRAASISAEAHTEAMRAICPGMMEYEIEALIENRFRVRGATGPAYNSIVGSGVNATILHYIENESPCGDGELLLVDAGAEVEGYSADITRTFPVSGRFTPAQREVYEIVLAAQTAAIDGVRPGRRFDEVHEAALRVLVEGLVRLGILQGPVPDLIEKEAYKPYYMHKTSHWLGLDVHDVGAYRRGDSWRNLEPGMVLTVEPGLYFAENADVPHAYRGMGIRIEDDVAVTRDEPEVLTAAVPKRVDEVEAVMSESPGRDPAPVGAQT